ncbi:hypothetical protein BDV97DRAFT_41771 [Delphinella strobiligena]|nr:hypothetical protein BDV97DRAFT_41771 [Delphinella strobiligena]
MTDSCLPCKTRMWRSQDPDRRHWSEHRRLHAHGVLVVPFGDLKRTYIYRSIHRDMRRETPGCGMTDQVCTTKKTCDACHTTGFWKRDRVSLCAGSRCSLSSWYRLGRLLGSLHRGYEMLIVKFLAYLNSVSLMTSDGYTELSGVAFAHISFHSPRGFAMQRSRQGPDWCL